MNKTGKFLAIGSVIAVSLAAIGIYESTHSASASGYKKGDVNGDGVVDQNDINATEAIILGRSSYTSTTGQIVAITPQMIARADVNGNGVVDMGDVVAIENIMASGG